MRLFRRLPVVGAAALLLIIGGAGLLAAAFSDGPAGADSTLGGFTVTSLAEAVTAQYEQPNFPLPATPSLEFDEGYASTTDSDETLVRISAVGSGNVAASVTFISHQKTAISRDHSSCTLWAITLYLVRHGSGYLIGVPPAGYWASYQAC